MSGEEEDNISSYRLHCWVDHCSGLKKPRIGGWAPIVHLRCGVGEDDTTDEEVLMYTDGGAAPVFKYYLRIAVVSPLDEDVVITVRNSKGLGKPKLGTVVVEMRDLMRGTPVGFKNFTLLNRKNRPAGLIRMRLALQYPESLTLPPNNLSRAALAPFKHRGADTLLQLSVLEIEGIHASRGFKMNIINFQSKIQTRKEKVVDGTNLDEHFWITLQSKTLVFTFKKRKLASWHKIGQCTLDLLKHNSGAKECGWHEITNKKNIVVAKVRLEIQMQFHHSVIVPPECTVKMLRDHKEEIFATTTVFSHVRALEASRNENAHHAPIEVQPLSVEDARREQEAVANRRREQEVAADRRREQEAAAAAAAEEAARQEEMQLRLALEASKRTYEIEKSYYDSVVPEPVHSPHPPPIPTPAPSSVTATAVALPVVKATPTEQRNANAYDFYDDEDFEDDDVDDNNNIAHPPPVYGVPPTANAIRLQPAPMERSLSDGSHLSQSSHGDVGREVFKEAMATPESRHNAYPNFQRGDAYDSESESDEDEQGGGLIDSSTPATTAPVAKAVAVPIHARTAQALLAAQAAKIASARPVPQVAAVPANDDYVPNEFHLETQFVD